MRTRLGHSSKVRATALASLVVVVASARLARAEEPPHSPEPAPEAPARTDHPSAPVAASATSAEVKAPEPTSPLAAPYPRGAEGAADVVLELLVTTTGEVRDPKVIEGREPFSSAALAAIRKVTFKPAERAGAPVAARIRTKISFLPPIDAPPEIPPDPYVLEASDLPANPYADGATDEPVVDVEVLGKRRIAGKTSLGRAEIRDMPGAFGDGFRAIEALPGVVPMASGLPFFFVRGAPPGSAGYFLDGIRLPVLFHLGAGPSVVHPGLVDQVDFYPGSAPVAFGRTSGGIVSANTKEPPGRLHGEGNVRLLDAGLLVESPLPKERGAVLAAGRFGYPGLLLPLFAPNTKLSYWDYQGRLVLDFGKNDHVTVMVLGSYDYLGRRARSSGNSPTISDPIGLGENENPGLETRTIFETEFHRLDVRYDKKTDTGRMRVGLTWGFDRSALGLKDRLTADMIQGRVEWENALSKTLVARGGFDVLFQSYEVQGEGGAPANAEFVKLFPKRDELSVGARADLQWSPVPRAKLTMGVRFDHYGAYRIDGFETAPSPDPLGGSQIAVEPRVASRIGVFPRVVFVSTAGLASQPPRFVLPLPGLSVGRLAEGLERSVQTSHGVELTLPASFTLTTTFFGSRTIGLADVFAACPGARNAFTDGNACTARSQGAAYGLEVYLKRAFSERLTGFVSYTLSRSTRIVRSDAFGALPVGTAAPDIPNGTNGTVALTPGTVEIVSDYDRTHVFNAAAAYDIGRGYRAGLRFVLYTGRPYTPTRADGSLLAAPNSERLPLFSRFDVRLEKKWTFGPDRYVSVVLEGLNVTLRKEATGVTCGTTAGPDDVDLGNGCVADEVGPIAVPSLGVEGAF